MHDEEDDAREAARQRRIADACMRDPDRSSDPSSARLDLYRRLIQGNLATVARRLLPRTAHQLDLPGDRGFDRWFAHFLADGGPRTPYLRDVPGEFVAWALPRWSASSDVAAFVIDLAQHEIDRFAIESAPRDGSPPEVGEVLRDRPLVFATPRKLARYEHSVDDVADPARPLVTHVLLHRDDDNTVHATVIEASRHRLLGLLLDRVPLGEALAHASDDDPATPDDTERVLDAARWLAALGETGALLGGER